MLNKINVIMLKNKVKKAIAAILITATFGYAFAHDGGDSVVLTSRHNPVHEEFEVEGGRFYEVTVSGHVGETDLTNLQAIAVCYFSFESELGPQPAYDALLTGVVPGNEFLGYEYLFSDCALNIGSDSRWIFQVRVPAAATNMKLEIKPWKNLSPIGAYNIQVVPCSETSDFVVEGQVGGLRKAIRCNEFDTHLFVVGCCDDNNLEVRFMPWTTDGEGIAQLLTLKANGEGRFSAETELLRGTFGGVVEISAVSNKAQKISHVRCWSAFKPVKLPSEKKPLAFSCAVLPGDILKLSGRIISDVIGPENPKAAVMSIIFEAENGSVIRTRKLPFSEKFGEYVYLPAGNKSNDFKRDILVPSGAVRVNFRVSRFYNQMNLILQHFSAKAEVTKFRNALIDAKHWKVEKDASLTATALVDCVLREWLGPKWERIRLRDDNPTVQISSNHSMIIGEDCVAPDDARTMRLRDYPAVSFDPTMNWSMNPFTNSTWQLKYYSCYWIPFLGGRLKGAAYYEHCKSFFRSFMGNMTYPNGHGTIAYNDHTCAARIEGILLMMYGKQTNAETDIEIPSLRSYLATDPDFFREIMYQLSVDVGIVDHHLRAHTFGLHNHNLIMARALLQFADCFRNCSFSQRYRETALKTIFEHLYGMFEPDGFIREQSVLYHHSFMRYFAELFRYMKVNNSVSPKVLDIFKVHVSRLIETDLLLCPPDGRCVSMGDTADNEIRRECLTEIELMGGSFLDLKRYERFSDLPKLTVFKDSGLYIFRNPTKGRFLLIDLSDSLKVHGHRDLGSWQYFSNGARWVSDIGGPYRYGTPQYRNYIKSGSHTVVELQKRPQTAGVAFNVELVDDESSWMLKCQSNVYGPSVGHYKKFVIKKDLSSFSVCDLFTGHEGGLRGRLTLAPGCEVSIDYSSATALLSNGQACLKIDLPESSRTTCSRAYASFRSNTLVPMWAVDSYSPNGRTMIYHINECE